MGDTTQVPTTSKTLTPEEVEINRLRVRVVALERKIDVLIGLSPEATKLLQSDPEQPWFE